jgi:hypothetical protein
MADGTAVSSTYAVKLGGGSTTDAASVGARRSSPGLVCGMTSGSRLFPVHQKALGHPAVHERGLVVVVCRLAGFGKRFPSLPENDRKHGERTHRVSPPPAECCVRANTEQQGQ